MVRGGGWLERKFEKEEIHHVVRDMEVWMASLWLFSTIVG